MNVKETEINKRNKFSVGVCGIQFTESNVSRNILAESLASQMSSGKNHFSFSLVRIIQWLK